MQRTDFATKRSTITRCSILSLHPYQTWHDKSWINKHDIYFLIFFLLSPRPYAASLSFDMVLNLPNCLNFDNPFGGMFFLILCDLFLCFCLKLWLRDFNFAIFVLSAVPDPFLVFSSFSFLFTSACVSSRWSALSL